MDGTVAYDGGRTVTGHRRPVWQEATKFTAECYKFAIDKEEQECSVY